MQCFIVRFIRPEGTCGIITEGHDSENAVFAAFATSVEAQQCADDRNRPGWHYWVDTGTLGAKDVPVCSYRCKHGGKCPSVSDHFT